MTDLMNSDLDKLGYFTNFKRIQNGVQAFSDNFGSLFTLPILAICTK